ncbi:Pentatricopeptide repeat-containing protein [Thalictrum thalictroides]|uniref:Pentatricopeptide repeat-containing protein n=1 Tax=Thalictrum thalictroides TaxID=46969 RepID=A0A7J6UVT1_THATH|nr:Pentatricopeptide repeat-containing protein [Thalictrum thalictroides]
MYEQIPRQQIRILDHPDLQDGFDNTWSSILIAKILKEETATWGIDLLITFDSYGISGHRNHRDVHNGICTFLCEESHGSIDAWELVSTSIVRKYSGPLDVWLSIRSAKNSRGQMYCLLNKHPRKSFTAMAQHQSQWIWFRKLFVSFSTCGIILDARHLFEGMPIRDVVTWNAMVAGYAKVMLKQTNQTRQFKSFKECNLRILNLMLAALSACAHLGALELGKWIHEYIDKRGLYKMVLLTNVLIDMYVKSGSLEKGLQVFEKMKHRSVITWTTIIAGLALHGFGNKALEMFSCMERERVRPNAVTFVAILSACSHVGLVEMGPSGRWHEVGIVRKGMWDKGVKKNPGGSSIEVDNVVHEFIAGDNSHVQFERIQGIMYVINGHLKMAGYVPKECRGLLEHEEA